MVPRAVIGDACRGPVPEATTREQCNALHPGSHAGRASSLRRLRQLRLGKRYRGEGCLAVARRAKAGLGKHHLISPKMTVDWAVLGFRGCGIWSKDHPRARVTRALGLGDAQHARPFFVPKIQSES